MNKDHVYLFMPFTSAKPYLLKIVPCLRYAQTKFAVLLLINECSELLILLSFSLPIDAQGKNYNGVNFSLHIVCSLVHVLDSS